MNGQAESLSGEDERITCVDTNKGCNSEESQPLFCNLNEVINYFFMRLP